MSAAGRYLWFYTFYPPAQYRTLGVVDFEKDENALTVKLPDGVDTEFPLCVKLELA